MFDYLMQKLTQLFNRLAVVFLIAGMMATVATTAAQSEPDELESLTVELWPDYDRPSMLVLLTGTLPAGTPLPATLTIAVPSGAEIHAVASFNEAGALLTNVDYTISGGQMTLTTPSLRFRVEYYDPYVADGDQYSYTFDWQSGLSAAAVNVVVQQPRAAVDFTVTPAAASTAANRGDGLTYHTLPARAVGANEPFTVVVSYTADAPVLSAPSQTLPGETAAPVSTPPSPSSSGFNPLWLLAIAGGLALLGGAWWLGQRQGRTASRKRKPQPTRPASSRPAKASGGAARYCHQCGKPARPGDTFCRNCGTQLKAD